ncbi:MAG TPA: alpha-mannosidase [Candidatus Limnocylindria bacterium]|nr:alpha-mannosidase [Candidatus Limnocylindria bacterium]
MSSATRILLVPHTHWDREWYRPFQAFRMQLVELVDRVLEMLEREPEFAFTLDGQLATVDDYLEVRPNARERIERFVRERRLAIGPWQILMDEFLVSGENIVRNLEMGWARAEELGGAMPVGYLPDMFGHIAQMPQILRRAGLAEAVVWRGVPAGVTAHRFRWSAPDGSVVATEYLPLGYDSAAHLFAVPERLERAVDRFLAEMRPWFGRDQVLAMYGADHGAPIPDLAALVARLNEIHDEARIEIGTLAAYIGSAGSPAEDVPRWCGEMRSSARANVLMGVTSARIDLKAACARAERLLERYAEPLSALHLGEDAWPAAFLALAWRRVVENSAHDSICGCSVDPVVEQVLVRFAEAEQLAAALTRGVAVAVAADVPRGALAVLNPSAADRDLQVEVDLGIAEEWDEVSLELPDGRRTPTQELRRHASLLYATEISGAEIDDVFRRFHGREVFDHQWNGYQIDEVAGRRRLTLLVDVEPDPIYLDVEEMRGEIEAVLHASRAERWSVRIMARPRRRLLARLPAPALGWTAARPVSGPTAVGDDVRVIAAGRGLRNDRLTVRIARDGTLEVETPDGERIAGVGRLVDGGDAGDSYNWAPPRTDLLVATPDEVHVHVEELGPLRGRLRVERTYAWPDGLLAGGVARSPNRVPTTVTTHVELRAAEPFLRIGLAFENRCDDHRFRFHVPLRRSADVTHAEGGFAVVERGMVSEGGNREVPLPTYPARGWVDAGGMAVLLDHVLEYQLLADDDQPSGRELALTVLRATGLISRNANPYRLDPAGPEIAIPAAQCPGPWSVRFAIYPHAGSWEEADVARRAEEYAHPAQWAPGGDGRPPRWPPRRAGEAGCRIAGPGVVLSALRRRSGGWLELRLVNERPHAAEARVDAALTAAREADLLGRPGRPLELGDDGRLTVSLAPWEIRTLHVRRREPRRQARLLRTDRRVG